MSGSKSPVSFNHGTSYVVKGRLQRVGKQPSTGPLTQRFTKIDFTPEQPRSSLHTKDSNA